MDSSNASEVQFQDQAGGHEPARALDSRRERGRGEYLHPVDSRAGTAHAKYQDCGLNHDFHGNGRTQRKLPAHIQKIYYPIDRRDYVQRAILTVHPEAIVLVEAEIWPNFLWRARELRIPTFLVNARCRIGPLEGIAGLVCCSGRSSVLLREWVARMRLMRSGCGNLAAEPKRFTLSAT